MRFLAEYIPTVYLYARNRESDDLQNNLRSFLSVEAVDDFFFIDAIANSYPTYISPFLVTPARAGRASRRTVRSRPPWGSAPTYAMRPSRAGTIWSGATTSGTRTAATGLANSFASRFAAAVEAPPTRLSYGLDYTYLYTRDAGQATSYYQQVGRFRPVLRATRKLNVSARLGYESNNYEATRYTGAVYGAGVDWTPSPRTKLEGFLEHRFFGASYAPQLQSPHAADSLEAERYAQHLYDHRAAAPPAAGHFG